jgi:hypothetical protein
MAVAEPARVLTQGAWEFFEGAIYTQQRRSKKRKKGAIAARN